MAEAVRQLCFENFGRRQLVTTEFWQRALQPLGVTGTPFGYTVSLSGFPVIAGVIEAGLQRDIRRFLGLSCLICFLLLLGLQKLLPAAAVISLGTLTAALVGLCAYPLTGFPLDMSAFLLLFTLTGTIGTFFFLTLAWNTPGSQRLIGVAGLGPGLLFVPLLLADLPSTRMIGLIITIGWLTGLGIQQILLPAWLAKLPKIER
jgi:predicted RND superfamily exporter protein